MTDRHQFRACWHDYNGGIYFVTICCADKRHYFGEIRHGIMNLTPLGVIVTECINEIPSHHKNVEIWNSVVMPNHIHLVISITLARPVGAQYIAPAIELPPVHESASPTRMGCLRTPQHGDSCPDFHFNSSLAVVVRTFKAACTRLAKSKRAQCIAPLPPIWQRNYHEHIIRNQRAYENIMNYIDNNVVNWCNDTFNVNRIDNADAINRVPTTPTDHEA